MKKNIELKLLKTSGVHVKFCTRPLEILYFLTAALI